MMTAYPVGGGMHMITGFSMEKLGWFWLLVSLFPTLVLAAPQPELWPRWQSHDPASSVRVEHAAWGEFLARYVVANHPSGINRVRYAAVSHQDRQALNAYLTRLQGLEVSGLDRTEQKAYWINLYNALTVKLILDHYPVQSIRDIDISPGWFSNGPWDAKLLTIEGEQLSLNDIEHRILRPIWQDNRVHYAVNCASLGCPNLQPIPFFPASLDEQLEGAAREFVNHPRGVRSDAGQLTISSIYDWFQVDFGGRREGVRRHLLQYAEPSLVEVLNDHRGEFSYSYNWNLNE